MSRQEIRAVQEPHSGILQFANSTQALASVWLDVDQAQRLTRLWDTLHAFPQCHSDEDRVVTALILRRIAEAHFRAKPQHALTVAQRVRRLHLSDLHVASTLVCMQREFMNSGVSLQQIARRLRISSPYLSHLISANTGHGFRTHLSGLRILHAAYLLVNTPLSTKEIAVKSGYANTASLDHQFRLWFHMTPGDFKRWAA